MLNLVKNVNAYLRGNSFEDYNKGRERESEECVKDYSTEKSEEHRLRD